MNEYAESSPLFAHGGTTPSFLLILVYNGLLFLFECGRGDKAYIGTSHENIIEFGSSYL